jgi:catechol 2,3-dioxygenase-like lactoylglutathione lyase family enzyme
MALKNPTKLFPMFITKDLAKTKRFYTKAGFDLRFDMDEYLQVSYGGPNGPELCFMKPHSSNNGTAYPEFGGKGVIVSIPTKDADAKYKELQQGSFELLSTPEDKPWGWRSFHAVDPNGVILDFFHVYKEVQMPDATS